MRISMLAVAVVVGFTGGSAWAGLTHTFATDNSADRSAWEALAGPFTLHDFATGAPNPSIGVTMSSTTNTPPTLTFTGGYFIDTPNGATYTQFDFASPVTAAGLWVDLNPGTVGTGLTFVAYFEGGGVGNIVVNNNTTNGGSTTQGFDGFVGFIADTPVVRWRVFEGNQNNLGSAETFHGDDLVFNPEPTTAMLLGVGGLCVARRRARR